VHLIFLNIHELPRFRDHIVDRSRIKLLTPAQAITLRAFSPEEGAPLL